MNSTGWKCLALACTILGVPVAACGGRVLFDGAPDGGGGGGDSASGTTGGNGSSGGSSATSTSNPTGGTSTSPASSSSASSTGGTFGSSTATSTPPSGTGVPPACTTYPTWGYSCPPSQGTAGCKYRVPIDGDPANGWIDSTTQSESFGCVVEIVAHQAADSGLPGCYFVADCTCNGYGVWLNNTGAGQAPRGSYCPND